jgi:hypothetical protein
MTISRKGHNLIVTIPAASVSCYLSVTYRCLVTEKGSTQSVERTAMLTVLGKFGLTKVSTENDEKTNPNKPKEKLRSCQEIVH